MVVGSWCIWCTFLPVSLLWPRQVLDTQKPSEQTNERRPQLQHTHTRQRKSILNFVAHIFFFLPALPPFDSINPLSTQFPLTSFRLELRQLQLSASINAVSEACHTHTNTLSTCNEIHILRCRPPTPLPLSCS